MRKLVYKKNHRINTRVIARFVGLFILLMGLTMAALTFYPLIAYEVYIQPAFANQSFASPIPQATIINQNTISSLLANTANQISQFANPDDTSWLPPTSAEQYKEVGVTEGLDNFYLAIPALSIPAEYVSMTDNDVNLHLIHFPGTAIPPDVGNAVIFGHSTIPQWFNPENPHDIFATALNTKIGDAINITVGSKSYTYNVISMTIVPADDTSYLAQDSDGSYLSIITCTPPGTTWQRLVIKAKLAQS